MRIHALPRLPTAYGAFGKIAASLLRRQPANLVLPDVSYRIPKLRLDAQHVQRYQSICAWTQIDVLPSTYLSTLSMTLQLRLMAHKDFPFKVLGAVHMTNHIRQSKPVQVTDEIDFTASFGSITPHDKGQLFSTLCTAQVGGEVVWQCTATYLVRSKDKGLGGSTSASTATFIQPLTPLKQQQSWTLPANSGRRYAAVSGDYNFIHLYPWTAKLFGFRSAIAHGMWLAGRSLSVLSQANMVTPAHEMLVAFKTPTFLPAQVCFHYEYEHEDAQASKTTFHIVNAKDGRPHLTGSICPLLGVV